jgi:hypothetical protein
MTGRSTQATYRKIRLHDSVQRREWLIAPLQKGKVIVFCAEAKKPA